MKEILVNVLFTGAYLNEGSNIGHEVINLFRADDGKNYLFITPHGTVTDKHDLAGILFVQHVKGHHTVEVVMKAEGLIRIAAEEEQNISYAGVKGQTIFGNNMHHGGADVASALAGYRAEEVRLPKGGRRILLTIDPTCKPEDDSTVFCLETTKKIIAGQAMRSYFPADTKTLQDLLNDSSLWEEENTTQKLIADGVAGTSRLSFLEVIRKENDELVFSNLLAYYFGYKRGMFVKFAAEVLGIPDFSPQFRIEREQKNIDLLIEDEEHILVIENKIKSNINGKTDSGEDQRNKYHKAAEEMAARAHKKAFYFIFAPNYNTVSPADPEMKALYKLISYKEIYAFYEKHVIEYVDDRCFADFLTGLRKHTMSLSELRFSIMRSRFLEKANQQ